MKRTIGTALLVITLSVPLVATAANGTNAALGTGLIVGGIGGYMLGSSGGLSGLLGGGSGSQIDANLSDKMCSAQWDYTCTYPGHDKAGKQCGYNFPCSQAISGGLVTGVCVQANICHGQKYTGLNGKTTGVDSGLSQLGSVLGQLMGKLMQSSSQSPATAPVTTTPANSAGCTTYYQSSVPSSDPCAYYVPNTSSLLNNTTGADANISGDLLGALGGDSASTDIGSLLTDTAANTSVDVSNDNTNVNTNASSSTSATSTNATSTVQLLPGLGQGGGAQGNIEVQPNGATIIANTVDTTGNSAVAGFYGSDTTLGSQQPQGIVAGLCQSRPWAGNVLSYIIPPSFFDGLCQWQGYAVGSQQQTTTQPAPQTVTLTQTPVPANSQASSTPTVSTVPPKVQIGQFPHRSRSVRAPRSNGQHRA